MALAIKYEKPIGRLSGVFASHLGQSRLAGINNSVQVQKSTILNLNQAIVYKWTTHLTPNKRHFPQMQALGAQECKGAGWKQQLHCRSLGRVNHFLYVQPEKPATKITTTTTPMI